MFSDVLRDDGQVVATADVGAVVAPAGDAGFFGGS
jgi:hypothetical protein